MSEKRKRSRMVVWSSVLTICFLVSCLTCDWPEECAATCIVSISNTVAHCYEPNHPALEAGTYAYSQYWKRQNVVHWNREWMRRLNNQLHSGFDRVVISDQRNWHVEIREYHEGDIKSLSNFFDRIQLSRAIRDHRGSRYTPEAIQLFREHDLLCKITFDRDSGAIWLTPAQNRGYVKLSESSRLTLENILDEIYCSNDVKRLSYDPASGRHWIKN